MSQGIYFRQTGDTTDEAVIAIHGLFGSLENLGVVSKQLSEQFCVYALDLPNHGRSAHIQTMTLANTAEAIMYWMEEQGIASAHFLGHSLGGKVAMEIALRYPEKVNRLIVADIAPVAYAHRHQDVFDAFHAVNLHTISSRGEADKAMQPYVSEVSTRSFLLKNLEKNEQGWQWRMNLVGLIESYKDLIAAISVSYPSFDGQVLFIKGELSSYILPEHRERVLTLFPHASVKVIEGAQHWLHSEKPAAFFGLVSRFLQQP